MYLNRAFAVKFILLNPATYQLLLLLQTQAITGLQGLQQLATMIQHPQPDAVIAFGLETLNDLMRQEAIWGTQPLPIGTANTADLTAYTPQLFASKAN